METQEGRQGMQSQVEISVQALNFEASLRHLLEMPDRHVNLEFRGQAKAGEKNLSSLGLVGFPQNP
jgi:hypothetical protein